MIVRKTINNIEVFVSSHEIFVYNDQNLLESGGFGGAFKLDDLPGLIAGEFVKHEDKTRLFATALEAVDAAFRLAELRLEQTN